MDVVVAGIRGKHKDPRPRTAAESIVARAIHQDAATVCRHKRVIAAGAGLHRILRQCGGGMGQPEFSFAGGKDMQRVPPASAESDR